MLQFCERLAKSDVQHAAKSNVQRNQLQQQKETSTSNYVDNSNSRLIAYTVARNNHAVHVLASHATTEHKQTILHTPSTSNKLTHKGNVTNHTGSIPCRYEAVNCLINR